MVRIAVLGTRSAHRITKHLLVSPGRASYKKYIERCQVNEEPLCGCATSKSLFIYLLLLITFKSVFSFAENWVNSARRYFAQLLCLLCGGSYPASKEDRRASARRVGGS